MGLSSILFWHTYLCLTPFPSHRLSPHRKERSVKRNLAILEKEGGRMRYEDFRRKGLFMGSGVVEAGCRVLIRQRLNQSGMFWTVNGANSIIALWNK